VLFRSLTFDMRHLPAERDFFSKGVEPHAVRRGGFFPVRALLGRFLAIG